MNEVEITWKDNGMGNVEFNWRGYTWVVRKDCLKAFIANMSHDGLDSDERLFNKDSQEKT